MPPWLDSAEEVGAVIVAVLAVLGTIAAAALAALGVVIAAWRSKIKPLLTSTATAAETAADQLTPNHGSSARDALGRIERAQDELRRDLTQRLVDVRADMRSDREQHHRDHSNIFRRLNHLESPLEDTRP